MSDTLGLRPSDPVRHSARCLALRLVYDTPSESDLRIAASESEELWRGVGA